MKNLLLIILLTFSLSLISVQTNAKNLSDAFENATLGKVAGEEGAGFQRTGLNSIVGTTIKTLLSLLGVVFVALLIYGGFTWMNSKGNEQEVTKAKQTIMAAIIGLLIVISAYAISYFIIGKLSSQILT